MRRLLSSAVPERGVKSAIGGLNIGQVLEKYQQRESESEYQQRESESENQQRESESAKD